MASCLTPHAACTHPGLAPRPRAGRQQRCRQHLLWPVWWSQDLGYRYDGASPHFLATHHGLLIKHDLGLLLLLLCEIKAQAQAVDCTNGRDGSKLDAQFHKVMRNSMHNTTRATLAGRWCSNFIHLPSRSSSFAVTSSTATSVILGVLLRSGRSTGLRNFVDQHTFLELVWHSLTVNS